VKFNLFYIRSATLRTRKGRDFQHKKYIKHLVQHFVEEPISLSHVREIALSKHMSLIYIRPKCQRRRII
jgi:hypothetical protein